MKHRINDMAVSIIARRQPMAADLRMVVTAIQVANDLERTGDMAKQLAKRTLQIESLGARAEVLQWRQAHDGPRGAPAARRRSTPMPSRDAAGRRRCLQPRRRSRCACTPRCSANC